MKEGLPGKAQNRCSLGVVPAEIVIPLVVP